MLPINLTISPSYKCNSCCKTCFVRHRKTKNLILKEWQKIFENLGKSPFWVTVCGGEPFLNKDLADFVILLSKICQPRIINIPTNGLLSEKIQKDVKKILANVKKNELIINLSLDGVGEEHDKIRQIPGNFEKAMKTYRYLREIKAPNFILGVHTVISKFNVDKVPEIYNFVMKELKPDSYITEIAEERAELQTIGKDIAPPIEKYEKAVNFLLAQIEKEKWQKVSKITQAFRKEYYRLVLKTLKEKRQIISCYAGLASAQIAPNGDVWTCCIKAEPLGNLKRVGWDFKKIWFFEKADKARKAIKNKECFCPLANASYTNMLMDFETLVRVGRKLL